MEGPEKKLLELVSIYRTKVNEMRESENDFDKWIETSEWENLDEIAELATDNMVKAEERMFEARERLFNFLDEYYSDETDPKLES